MRSFASFDAFFLDMRCVDVIFVRMDFLVFDSRFGWDLGSCQDLQNKGATGPGVYTF